MPGKPLSLWEAGAKTSPSITYSCIVIRLPRSVFDLFLHLSASPVTRPPRVPKIVPVRQGSRSKRRFHTNIFIRTMLTLTFDRA